MAFDHLQQRETRTARQQLDALFFFIRRALRHSGKATAIVVVGLGLSVGGALLAKRTYRSETVVLYREVIDAIYVQGSQGRRFTARELGIRLRELVLSRPRLKEILDEYKLFAKVRAERSDIEAEDLLRRYIDFRFGGGDTFHISFLAPTPELAQKVTQRLGEALIEEERRLRVDKAQHTVKFLEDERNRAQREMVAQEKAQALFLSRHPEFAADENRGSGAAFRVARNAKEEPTSSPLDTLQRQLRRLRDQLAQAEGRKPVVVRDPRLLALQTQSQQELEAAKVNLRAQQAQYTDKYPSVVRAKERAAMAQARLRRIEAQIQATATVTPLNTQAKEALRNRMVEVQQQIARLRQRGNKKDKDTKVDRAATKIVELETEWTGVNRKVTEARERYNTLDARLYRARLAALTKLKGGTAHMSIIDKAYLPKRPAGGGRGKIVMLGGAVSLFFAMGIVLALALIDERIYNAMDAERLQLGEVLVVVPITEKGLLSRRIARWRIRRQRKRA